MLESRLHFVGSDITLSLVKNESLRIPGSLVTIPLGGKNRPMDGFLAHGPRAKRRLLVLVHGMGGNFYRSRFRKELLLQSASTSFDTLAFSNRGSDADVASERFRDCLADLDAALRWARGQGYRQFVLMGHSTGCQKVTYYQALRNRRDVEAVVLGAIGDDMAISKRTLKRKYKGWIHHARRLVARGKGHHILPPECLSFSAARFLSCADPRQREAQLFNFEGRLAHFRRLRCPTLVVMGSDEEHACMPVPEMIRRLERATKSIAFDSLVIPGGDHGFHGKEHVTAKAVMNWLGTLTHGKQ
jgi:pimeloyl-ACP methyl ester carboxylesterase